MDDLQTEKEQLEEMRQWWSEYGYYVIGGIVIGAGLLFGWNKYDSNKLESQQTASVLFEELANHVADGDVSDAELVADQLALDYADTPYTAQSKLAMARLYMDRSRDQDAVDVLNQLLAMRGHDELKDVGRLRLASIMLYQDRAEEVVALLEGEDSAAFAALYSEQLGDAYAALGNYVAAEEAYKAALSEAGQQTIDRAVVQMKLIDLPEIAAAPVAETLDAVPAEPAATSETDVDVADEADEAEEVE